MQTGKTVTSGVVLRVTDTKETDRERRLHQPRLLAQIAQGVQRVQQQ